MFAPGFLRWKYFFYFFPIHFIIVIFLSTPVDKVFSQLPKWLFVVIGSYTITAIPFALAMNLSFIAVSGKREFIALIVIGVVRGFALLDIGLLLDLPQVKPYLLRPLNSSVTVPLWFLILRHLIGSRIEFNKLFHELYLRNIQARINKVMPRSSNFKESEIDIIEEKVRETLEPLKQNIETLTGAELSVEDMKKEMLIIQSFIEERLRPLSHELWRQQRIAPPRLNYLQSLIKLIFETKSQFGYAILPTFVFGLVGTSTFETFDFAWRHSLLHLVVQVIIFLAFEYMYSRVPKAQKYLNIVAIFFCVFIPLTLDRILLSNYPSSSAFFFAELIGVGWFLLLALAFSIAKSQTDFQRELVTILLEDIEEVLDSTTQIDSNLASQYAKYLHGDIQSTLSSAQMQLKNAYETQDSELGKATIEKLASVLRRDHHDYAIGDAISPISKYQQIIDAWEGIATISVDIDDSTISEVALLRVAEVVEELVSNAVRHGGATVISVEVSQYREDVSVNFHDNGSPKKTGKSGMGSSLVKNQVLNFQVTSDKDGNRTTFQMTQ